MSIAHDLFQLRLNVKEEGSNVKAAVNEKLYKRKS